MCGICGFVVSRKRLSESAAGEALRKMTDSLLHRGPDQDGTAVFASGDCLVGLGHRRLSIIDLSPRGRQPMKNENGNVQIVFNGEIYNYRELRPNLEKNGHQFKSASDTESILHLYEEKGAECVNGLAGMFAFAIWNEDKTELLLGRDRIGIKPLFYTVIDDGIVFASEIKAILEFPGMPRKLRQNAVQDYITYGYVPAPETAFEKIHSLEPGTKLLWTPKEYRETRYWRPDKVPAVHGGIEQLADELDEKLNAAVESHLVADVEVGAFLSGGLDSSLVAAIAAKRLARPIRTFTIGFSGGGDEREYAKAAAASFPSVSSMELAEPDLASKLPQFLWHLEQPLFDNSVLPTYLVSSLAAQHCKVALSGDGGDEPFAGYAWTRAAVGIPGLNLSGMPQSWKWLYRKGIPGLAQRGTFDLLHGARERYLRRMLVGEGLRNWLLHPEYNQAATGYDPSLRIADKINAFSVKNWKERYPLADLCLYLPDDVLFKVDRMSMAHSLEVRVPLLDHRLVECVLALPWEMRSQRGKGKILLRRVARRYLPQAVTKPRKQGFTVPIGRWLCGELGDQLLAMFKSPTFAKRKIFRPERACELIRLHRSGRYELGHRIWSIAVFEMWCRIWLDKQSHKQTFRSLLQETGDLS